MRERVRQVIEPCIKKGLHSPKIILSLFRTSQKHKCVSVRENMENMNVTQVIMFLAKEFGFDRLNNTQDVVEFAVAIINQSIIEFTEDEIKSITINLNIQDGINVNYHHWDKDEIGKRE